MGNIPLPALGVQAPQQPDVMGGLSKLLAIRGMLGQQQLQQQAMQSGSLDLQMKQRQMQDQQTIMETAAAHGGSLLDALPELAGKISAATYTSLQKSIIDTQKSYAEKHKIDLDNEKASNDQLLGLTSQAKQLPADQYAQAWPQIAARAVEIDPRLRGHVDPGQPIPQQALDQLALGFATHSQLAAMETEKRASAEEQRKAAMAPSQLAESQAAAQIKQNQAANGGGIPVDQRELADYLKNPRLDKGIQKDAATFAAWKAKQSPTALTLNNMLGQGGQGSALDQAAERYSQTGELPAGFARSPGTTASIIKRSAELHPDQSIAANKATFGADSAALKKVQSTFDQMTAFEGTALKNLDLYAQKAKAIPDLGAKFANVPLRKITGDMIGSRAMAELNAARQTAATEVAKVLGSATGAGVLSDTQKKEALDVVNGNLPLDATLGVVDTLKQDMANRHQSYLDDINAIKGRMGVKTQSSQPSASPASASGGFSWDKMPEHK
jgi:hypothetical protein